ncbi:DNA-directed RNA polymerase [Chloropicon roscoffensis]|uniref:DNA-directed RNA polymerase n=1 Tax=Chloropicon roscoffensis TaxID=1461544 RepID=A0AAX4PJ52_9CHLO|mmetsp:Transcript_2732/g.8279  ORF Transcript_2732/g.8279 Transcript_2732/m.8279 type:complete len:151 (-) Transcript_2732:143-595(-)
MEADGDGQVQFEDSFEINEKDPDGKKFDRVSRYICQSDLYDMHLTLDINTEIYPLDVGEHFKLLLTDSIEGEKKDFGQAVWDQTGTQMDDYDYVMHGKIFKIETSLSTDNQQKLYVSFGGLLMLLVGDAKPLEQFKLDTYVYLLLKKTGA